YLKLMRGLIFINGSLAFFKKTLVVLLSCILVLSGGLSFNGVALAAGPATITFSSTESSAWNDGIAEDGDGGSFNIPDLNLQFYNITDTSGTLLVKTLVHGASEPADDHFDALSTYDPSLNTSGWKGMAIKSADGTPFQI